MKRSPTTSTIFVGLGLLALWGLSLGLSYVSMGAWALPIALTIAMLKAGLVLGFFMELGRERASVIYAFGIGVVMVLVLLAFVVADVLTRSLSPL